MIFRAYHGSALKINSGGVHAGLEPGVSSLLCYLPSSAFPF